MSKYNGHTLVKGNEGHIVCPVIASDVGISFWGGIDERTGIVIDHSHPLYGQSVAGSILCIPSGRGSCTGSQVLLELILNEKAPKALILRDRDGLVSVGALVAQAIFPDSKVLDILQIENFAALLEEQPKFGRLLNSESVVFGDSVEEVEDFVKYEEGGGTIDLIPETDLILSSTEQEMIDAFHTRAEKRAMECIIKYSHIVSDNPTYIDVKKAHIDGCTYIGPGGLAFAERLVKEGGKVKVPTTLNSVSTDLRNWERLGIEATESQKSSMKLADAYVALGCSERSFTCAPYLLNNPPELGDQIVWGESNAVVFANSVLGARTEKYADYLDICCAIVGKVPEVGVHIAEKRKPQVLLDASHIDFSTDDPASFSLLFPVIGHLCGTLSDGEVPLLIGLERYSKDITIDHMKDFCAAFGTTGTSPLIHVAGVTPEVTDEMMAGCKRKCTIDIEQLEETYKILDQQNGQEEDDEGNINWISLGNPHLSLSECENLARHIESLPAPRKKKEGIEVIACMSRELHAKSPAIPTLRDFGISFVNDTCWCMLLQPPMIPSNLDATILTNSGKYAHYGPGLTKRKFRLASMTECIDAAVTGKLSRRSTHPWSKQMRSYSTFSKRIDNATPPDLMAVEPSSKISISIQSQLRRRFRPLMRLKK